VILRWFAFLLWTSALVAQTENSVLVVTPHCDDYVLYAGGTLAGMIRQGASARVVRVTNDEKSAFDITPEEAALRIRHESDDAAKALGISEVIPLGYRSGELGAISPTELRDRITFLIRRYRPRVIFIPNPYTHHDDDLDHMHAGSAAEEAARAASLQNFQPPYKLAGLEPYLAPEIYYFGPPVDPEQSQPESTSTFVPQPKTVDITADFDRKLQAVEALKTQNRAIAKDVSQRLVRRGKRLPLLDRIDEASVKSLAETRLRNLGMTERFLYAGIDYQIPASYRK
jgi:LmbE family N-acetylglucosaminyl deacetylase